MLSLNTTIETLERKSLLEQAIAAHKLSEENFLAIVEVFNREQIDIEYFWLYVTGQRIKRDGHVTAAAISDAISQVLSIEEFNRLIDNDITWVN